MLKKNVKKAWVKALRSGEYKQGKERLCRQNAEGELEFCCLGVLADIALDTDWIEKIEDKRDLGLSAKDAQLLIDMNDTGKSFEQIAKYIEGRKTL